MELYIGCYTTKLSEELNGKGKGIAHYQIDSSAKSLSLISITEQRNPSYLCKHPELPVMYATEEVASEDRPNVYAYELTPDGSLSLLNTQPLTGAYGCHLAVVDGHLIVANYGSGEANVFPLQANGSISPMSDCAVHVGKGINENRQEGPHAHMVFPFNPSLLYVVDLGIDRCKAYALEAGKLIPVPSFDLEVDAGAGPRHMVRHPQLPFAYVFSELTAEVFVFAVGEKDAVFKHKVSALDGLSVAIPSGAAIKIHPSGKFLYTSERASNTIAQFAIADDGALRFQEAFPLTTQTPRDFAISSDGKELMVAGQDDDSLSFFEIGQNGSLTFVHTFSNVKTPVCLLEGEFEVAR